MSEEQKSLISKALKGRVFTDAWRAKISAARKGSTSPNKGVSMSEAQKLKLKNRFAGKGAMPYGNGGSVSPHMLEFANVLCPLGYEMDVVRIAHPTFKSARYTLDFAHREAKVNIEIDGTSHLKYEERDKIRDTHLRSLGWKVIRIKVY